MHENISAKSQSETCYAKPTLLEHGKQKKRNKEVAIRVATPLAVINAS